MATQLVFDFARGVKPCRKCGATDRKPSGACRPCANASTAAYDKAHPEKARARQRKHYWAHREIAAAKAAAYNKAHPEQLAARNAAYRKKHPDYFANWQKANPEKCRAFGRKWRMANLERTRAVARAYIKANPEKVRAAQAAYRAANPEKSAAQIAAWFKANPGRREALRAKHRAAKLQAAPKWPPPWNVDKLTTAFWNQRRPGEHVDHIIPLCGKTVCGLHVPWNLQVLPGIENLSKGNRFNQEKANADYLKILHDLFP